MANLLGKKALPRYVCGNRNCDCRRYRHDIGAKGGERLREKCDMFAGEHNGPGEGSYYLDVPDDFPGDFWRWQDVNDWDEPSDNLPAGFDGVYSAS